MHKRRTWVLHSGGLRSLVATAIAVSESSEQRVELLHVIDGRPTARQRHRSVVQQARHFNLGPPRLMKLTHLFDGLTVDPAQPPLKLAQRPQMLLAAAQWAVRHGIARLIWPGSTAGDVDAAATATEHMVICDHLGRLDGLSMPQLEAPLLEMTDVQIIELGLHLDTPWSLAWSCLRNGESPCQDCTACDRRRAAFDGLAVAAD